MRQAPNTKRGNFFPVTYLFCIPCRITFFLNTILLLSSDQIYGVLGQIVNKQVLKDFGFQQHVKLCQELSTGFIYQSWIYNRKTQSLTLVALPVSPAKLASLGNSPKTRFLPQTDNLESYFISLGATSAVYVP